MADEAPVPLDDPSPPASPISTPAATTPDGTVPSTTTTPTSPTTGSWNYTTLLVIAGCLYVFFILWQNSGIWFTQILVFLLLAIDLVDDRVSKLLRVYPYVKSIRKYSRITTQNGTSIDVGTILLILPAIVAFNNALWASPFSSGMLLCLCFITPVAIITSHGNGFTPQAGQYLLGLLLSIVAILFAWLNVFNISFFSVFVWWNANVDTQLRNLLPSSYRPKHQYISQSPLIGLAFLARTLAPVILPDSLNNLVDLFTLYFWGNLILCLASLTGNQHARSLWLAKSLVWGATLPEYIAFTLFSFFSMRVSVPLTLLIVRAFLLSANTPFLFMLVLVAAILLPTLVIMQLVGSTRDVATTYTVADEQLVFLGGLKCAGERIIATSDGVFSLTLPEKITTFLVQTGGHWGFSIRGTDPGAVCQATHQGQLALQGTFAACHYTGVNTRVLKLFGDEQSVKNFIGSSAYQRMWGMECSNLKKEQLGAVCRTFDSDARRTGWKDNTELIYNSNCAMLTCRVLVALGASPFSFFVDLLLGAITKGRVKNLWYVVMFTLGEPIAVLQWVFDDWDQPWNPQHKAQMYLIMKPVLEKLREYTQFIGAYVGRVAFALVNSELRISFYCIQQ